MAGCAGYEANYDKLHETRDSSESRTDTGKNKENITTADLTK